MVFSIVPRKRTTSLVYSTQLDDSTTQLLPPIRLFMHCLTSTFSELLHRLIASSITSICRAKRLPSVSLCLIDTWPLKVISAPGKLHC